MLQEIQVRGVLKNDLIRRGGGGGLIFSEVTDYANKTINEILLYPSFLSNENISRH